MKSDRDPTELVRYQIYVANMLTAYDEIFQIIDDKEWVASFAYDEDHLPYLCEQNDPAYYAAFTSKTRKLIDGQKKAHCTNLAPILKNVPSYPWPRSDQRPVSNGRIPAEIRRRVPAE